MTRLAILKSVKEKYPESKDLSKTQLRLIEKAVAYALEVGSQPELISARENERLLKKLGPKGGITPASSLKAYRLRQELTQQELAKKSGVSQANISAMEKGTRPIGLNVAKKLADVLRCDYRRLL